MANEKFVLVSLQEEKAKKLANVLSNDSSRKILDILAEKDATESEIAKKLDIPISTVHYNLKLLVEGGLVKADEFHYSEKGREVIHYHLANKYIIIAPGSVWGIKEKLRSILPSLLGVGVISWLVHMFRGSSVPLDPVFKQAASEELARAAPMFGVADSATAAQALPHATFLDGLFSSVAFWFVVGGVVSIVVYLLADYIFYKKMNK